MSKKFAQDTDLANKIALNNPTPAIRQETRRRRGGGGDAISENTFVMSLAGSSVNITAGAITVNETSNKTTYAVPKGTVDLSEYLTPTTVYIYVKLAANWLSGGEFILYPVLTVGAQNFAYNDTKFPADDLGAIFYPLGTVTITKPEDTLLYSLTQINFGNHEINALDNTSFYINQIYQAKASDSDTDSTYEIYVNSGQVTMPTDNPVLPQANDNVSNASIKYIYIKMTATKNAQGFWTSYVAEVAFSLTQLVNDDDITYILIGWAGISTNQAQLGNFISDGRIF